MQKLTFIIIVIFLSACGGNQKNKAQQEQGFNQEVERQYLEKGKEIAGATQTELLGVVQGAMATGGPGYAVGFCNLEALDLKDSLSLLYDCKIQRLSIKYRNPADKPGSKVELDQIKSYQVSFDKGEPLSPILHHFDDRVEYYQPITIASGACLVCHGDPATQIAEETMQIINEKYPNDLATGYALNDFRGVWKITFEK